MESESFSNPIRAQLTTAAHKPCTYFATDDRGTRVFVKGPYKDEEHATIPIKAFQFKSIFNAPVTPIKIVELVPDGMEDCQYGSRMSIDKEKPHFFQVADDILVNEDTLPTKKRSSQKAWKEPVDVVDWENLKHYSHVEYNKSYTKMIYKSDKKAARHFVKHIILSWICGAGADLAFSNFIHDKDNHKVFQVDHEAWLNFEWSVQDTRVGSSRTKAWDHLTKFVKSDKVYFAAFFEDLVSEDNVKRVEETFSETEAALLVERLNEVAADWTVVGTKVLTEIATNTPPPKKRALEVSVGEGNEEIYPKFVPPPAPKKTKVTAKAREPTPVPVNFNAPEYVNGIYVGQSTPTYRVATDPWGFSVTLRKSDMQKAIRRGNFDQALVAFFSCYNLHKVFPDVQNAKSIRTNMLNRLVICAMEDVGVANTNLVMQVSEMLDKAIKESIPDTLIATIIYNMCLSKKTRIQSHIAHAYHPKNNDLSMKHGIVLNPNPLSASDPNWFYVAALDPDMAWRHTNGRYPILYKIYRRMADRNKDAVLRFALAVNYFSATGAINPSEETWTFHSLPTNNPHIEEAFLNKYRLDPQECAYDKHTSEGSEKTTRQFREEGAIVNNECQMFNVPIYQQIYLNSNA